MSGLRDARLHKALESAPDEGERPREDTRAAIRARAHLAVKPGARTPWWKKLYASAGGSRHMPWNAAFATLALATLVSLLWHDREVPDAKLEPELKAAAPPQASSKHADAAEARRSAEMRALEQAKRARAAPTVPAEPARERGSPDAAAGPSGRERAGELAKQAPVADAAPMPAPPTPEARSVPAPAQTAPAPASPMRPQMLQRAEAVTNLRVALQGRTVQAPLARPSVLSDLIDRASREATGTELLLSPVELRVELEREQLRLGVLEIAGAQLRWTPMNGPPRTATPDPALLQALRDEIGRLAR